MSRSRFLWSPVVVLFLTVPVLAQTGSTTTGGSGTTPSGGANIQGSSFESMFEGIERTTTEGTFIGRGAEGFVGRGGSTTTSSRGITGRANTSIRSGSRTASRTSSRTASSRTSLSSGGVQGSSSSGRTVRPALAADEFDFSSEFQGTMIAAPSLQRRLDKISEERKTLVPLSVVLEDGTQGLNATLTGAVRNAKERSIAEQLVRLEPGVRSVRNEIVVRSELVQPELFPGLDRPSGTPRGKAALPTDIP